MNKASYTNGTIKAYNYEINKLLDYLHGKSISKVNKNDIEKYIFNIPASSVTRNRALTAIFKFFDILVMFEIIKKNPATGTKRLILEKKRAPVYLSEQKIIRYLCQLV